VLHSLTPHHRQVFLTASVLITMRQALDSPTLSTEDHLKFQGLDISAGAQLMEVIGSEMDHALPLDWPKSYGTVASLAAQAATYVSEMHPERIKGHGNPKVTIRVKKEVAAVTDADKKAAEKEATLHDPPKKPKGSPRPKDSAKPHSKGKSKAQPKKGGRRKKKEEKDTSHDELGHLSHFNRKATFRLVQQIAFLMRDQHQIVNAVLSAEDGDAVPPGEGVRTSRYITVAEKLFQMADNSKHDHCSFVLAVVIFHMVLRGLMLRVMYHRAAVCVQKRYRYLKSRGNKAEQVAPAIQIQRFWRGLRTALHTMKVIDAGQLIWRNYSIYRYNKRSKQLVRSTLTIQRYWRGALGRQWVRHCHDAATFVQKFVRKLLVAVSLDKPGRDIVRKFQKEMHVLLKSKESMTPQDASFSQETEFIARQAAIAGHCRVQMEKQRNRNVDMRRALSFNLRSKHTRKADREKMMRLVGRIQPARETMFEPITCAMARQQPDRLPARVGHIQSRVLNAVRGANSLLDKSLPIDPSRLATLASHTKGSPLHKRPHGATIRGRAALVAMRMAKTPKMPDSKTPLLNVELCGKWGARLLDPKGF